LILIGKIDDSFDVHNCCVVVFKLLAGRHRVNDPIQLRTPDGQVIDTYIAGFERWTYRPGVSPDRDIIGICFPKEITKQQVPKGTEIWSVKD